MDVPLKVNRAPIHQRYNEELKAILEKGLLLDRINRNLEKDSKDARITFDTLKMLLDAELDAEFQKIQHWVGHWGGEKHMKEFIETFFVVSGQKKSDT